ncbi:MAG: Uma2 family endonuclease [Oscillospiraceae bacterium]|nr:Uma2 family endonuclease [Oscillospiraceae bacterium]
MNSNLAYQEEFWEELINGRAVAMSPAATNHNRVASMIFHIFQGYLDGKSCEPFADNETVYLTKTDHFVPDCMVVCDKDKIKSDGVHGAPDLVVEVLSPSTARRDRGHKKDVYEACGVPEYWIVDTLNKSIEVYLLRDGKYIMDNLYILYPDFVLEKMKDEEKKAIVTEFTCHLYDDLVFSLEKIFSRVP